MFLGMQIRVDYAFLPFANSPGRGGCTVSGHFIYSCKATNSVQYMAIVYRHIICPYQGTQKPVYPNFMNRRVALYKNRIFKPIKY